MTVPEYVSQEWARQLYYDCSGDRDIHTVIQANPHTTRAVYIHCPGQESIVIRLNPCIDDINQETTYLGGMDGYLAYGPTRRFLSISAFRFS